MHLAHVMQQASPIPHACSLNLNEQRTACKSKPLSIDSQRCMIAEGGGGLDAVRTEVVRGVTAGSDDKQHRHAAAGLLRERGYALRCGCDVLQAKLRCGEAVQGCGEAVGPQSLHTAAAWEAPRCCVGEHELSWA